MDGLPGMQKAAQLSKKLGLKPMKKLVGHAGENFAYATGGHGKQVTTIQQLLLASILCLMVGFMGSQLHRAAEAEPLLLTGFQRTLRGFSSLRI